ncbi:MAG: dTDP-4-dehydrorhamnose reductase [Desulfovibrio sp.]|jgi:dTDP-4-dehydrorhamnose reductase|nr:dTDP-4-dehydrorhamnose reductase [Desulfovibrio sp.]
MAAKRKALVLGGVSGLLGQSAADIFQDAGWEVVRIGRRDIDFSAKDASYRLEGLVDSEEPELILNAVAYTKVDAAEEDADLAGVLNRALPATLGRIVKTRPCALVHYSTDFVFNGKKKSPYDVDDKPGPLNVYGKSKLAGEEALRACDLEKCLIIRTAWLFGPGRGNFVLTILNLAKKNKKINVIFDQTGSPTYTLDLAAHTLKLVEAEEYGVFHLVNSGQASWCDLADESIRLSQIECLVNPVRSQEYPQKALRPAYTVLDCARLFRVTGIKPRPWPQALRDYIYTYLAPEMHLGNEG